jgi:hypothetical protein
MAAMVTAYGYFAYTRHKHSAENDEESANAEAKTQS